MSARTVNLLLLLLIAIEILSGLASFMVGTPDGRWVFWAHAIGGLSLTILIPWKLAIAVNSFSNRGGGIWATLPLALSALVIGSLLSGLLWSTTGLPDVALPYFGSASGLTLHVIISLAILPLLAVHLILRWFPPQPGDFLGRRNALRVLATAGAGVIAWQMTEALSSLASLSGAERRFTGSREEGSFTGNRHPVTNWFLDSTQRIQQSGFRLRVHGRVLQDIELGYEDLQARSQTSVRSLLDCTGGWFTEQDWNGISLSGLLTEAGTHEEARSVIIKSVTGYNRRFSLSEATSLLLALEVGGETLSAAHGFPVRLVVPGWRGYNWVKWVSDVEVSDESPLLQPPLPLP